MFATANVSEVMRKRLVATRKIRELRRTERYAANYDLFLLPSPALARVSPCVYRPRYMTWRYTVTMDLDAHTSHTKKRLEPQEAIIRIERKLSNVIFSVFKTKKVTNRTNGMIIDIYCCPLKL